MGPSIIWRAPAYVDALGALGGGLALCGVLLMQRVGPAFTSLPTGILSQVFPDNAQWVLLGTLAVLLGCAGAFLWLPCSPRADAPAAARPTGRVVATGRAPVRARYRAWLAGAAGVALYGVVLQCAHSHATGPLSLLFLIVSLGCVGAVLAYRARYGGDARPRTLPLNRLDGLLILAITAAFIVVTAHDLRHWVYAYVGDEWYFFVAARAIATGTPFDPLSQAGVFGFNPVFDSLYQAAVMRLIGLDVVGWRMSCMLATAAAIPALYWGAKQIGGSAFAATAALLYAACPLLWAFAHIGYSNNDPLPFMCLAAALFFVGWRDDRPLFLYAAGVLAGACWYTFFGGRLMIAVLVAALLTDLRGGWSALGRRTFWLLGGFALAVLPLVLDNGSATFRQMAGTGRVTLALLETNSVRALYEMLFATMHQHYTAGALFDPVSAASLCLGVALALAQLRARWSRLMLLWFAIALGSTTPLNYAPEVSVTRSMVVIPPAALLAALGLCSVCTALAAARGRVGRHVLFPLALTGVLGLVAVLNWFHFFHYATDLPQRWPSYPVVVMTMEAITTQPDAAFILPADMPAQNPNGDLCTVLQGFRVDPWRVLAGAGAGAAPYCATVGVSPDQAVSTVFLLLDSSEAVARCATSPTIVYRENQGTLWTFRLRVPSEAAGALPHAIPARVRRLCPTLPA